MYGRIRIVFLLNVITKLYLRNSHEKHDFNASISSAFNDFVGFAEVLTLKF